VAGEGQLAGRVRSGLVGFSFFAIMHDKTKILLFKGILLSLILLAFEAVSYFTISKFLIGRGLVYTPQIISDSEYANYLEKRDMDLGWLQAAAQIGEVDNTGARYTPAFPAPSKNAACISIYGDSYTWSNRTTPEDAWGNQLSRLAGCRVANYGVSGFGTDQALLRVLHNDIDTAKVVILNHFVFDIFRNVNQHWGTRNSVNHTKLQFKPRFLAPGGDNLVLIPMPDFTLDEIRDLQQDPSKYLPYEYFLPDGHYGSSKMGFPYTLVMLKTIFGHTKFQSLFRGEPTHAPFYREEHPSNSLGVTSSILKTFHEEVSAQGRTPIITIIPYLNDFEYFERTKSWCYAPLLHKLRANGLQVINIGEKMLESDKDIVLEVLYAGEGHFSPKGDELMAQIVFDYLEENHLLAQ